MSNHSLAIVPIESCSYASPELKEQGREVDIGLLAEALIYYDRIAFNVSNESQFAEIIRWFWDRHCYPDLLALLSEGTLQFYEYAFLSLPLGKNLYTLKNVQTVQQVEPNSFQKRFLDQPRLDEFLSTGRIRDQLNRSFEGRVIEVKAKEYGNGILNAIEDFNSPDRVALFMQVLINEQWRIKGLSSPPKVQAKVHVESIHHIYLDFEPDIEELSERLGFENDYFIRHSLLAAIHCNRFLWSSACLGCDLFMPSPMGCLVGDKLDECGKTLMRNRNIIDSLQSEVDFPDIRQLVNNDQLSLREVLYIRKHAVKFRDWLKTEGDRDRNAIIAYHHEVGKELKMKAIAKKTLSLFGILGAPVMGTIFGTTIPHEYGPTIGASAGAGVGAFLTDMAAKIGKSWSPVVFGNWLREKTFEEQQE